MKRKRGKMTFRQLGPIQKCKLLFKRWESMMTRCYNVNNCNYRKYGGAGITVCDEWKTDPCKFIGWALLQDFESDLSIDRIDNNKGYSPENCRFATETEQQINRSNTHWITVDNETRRCGEWAELIGMTWRELHDYWASYGDVATVDLIRDRLRPINRSNTPITAV